MIMIKADMSRNKRIKYKQIVNPFSFKIQEQLEKYETKERLEPYFYEGQYFVKLFHGDCLKILEKVPEACVDLIFADPPYFLSNDGITCHAGKMVSVNKGVWDKSRGVEENHKFIMSWLSQCQRILRPNGTIWVSGTSHVIYSVGFAMQKLGFKIINDIIWQKTNPPPNLSCRYFTHSTEIILWAGKNEKSKHVFHYDLMKQLNNNRQMKNVWIMNAPAPCEKKYGKHPTQKPVQLLERILMASSNEGDIVLDPFCGSSTTGVAAVRLGRKYIGIDLEEQYLKLSIKRLKDAFKEKEKNLFNESSHKLSTQNKYLIGFRI